jgi:hypothetical protein
MAMALLLASWRPLLASGLTSVTVSNAAYQVDSDLANRCAVYIQRSDTPDDDIEGDIIAICRGLRAAARDGVNGPDDCVYFTTVVEAVPVKQAVAACQALLAPEAPNLLSSASRAGAPSAAVPSALFGPTEPPWIDEVLAELISAQLQLSGKQLDDAMIARMRGCLIRYQELGRNRALAPCAREIS